MMPHMNPAEIETASLKAAATERAMQPDPGALAHAAKTSGVEPATVQQVIAAYLEARTQAGWRETSLLLSPQQRLAGQHALQMVDAARVSGLAPDVAGIWRACWEIA